MITIIVIIITNVVTANPRLRRYLGRLCGGASSSLLYTAPESWLNAEAARTRSRRSLGVVFGWAYFLDGVVAVAAGRLANTANDASGPTGPFLLSAAFSVGAAVLVLAVWRENYGQKRQQQQQQQQQKEKVVVDAGGGGGGGGSKMEQQEKNKKKKNRTDKDQDDDVDQRRSSSRDRDGSNDDKGAAAEQPATTTTTTAPSLWSKVRAAVQLIRSDPKIQKLVVSQTAFEGAMYVRVRTDVCC